MNIIEFVNGLISKIPNVEMIPFAAILVPALAAIVSLVFTFFGKKLLNLLKFLVCAGGCYYLGAHILWNYVGQFLEPHGVTALYAGIALAVVGLFLSKFAYALVFAGALAYVAYLFVPAEGFVLIAAAAVVGVCALIFRGLCETIITSVGGGFGFSAGLYSAIVAITAALQMGPLGTGIRLNNATPVVGPLTFEVCVVVIATVVIGLGGYLHQVKNRHRY